MSLVLDTCFVAEFLLVKLVNGCCISESLNQDPYNSLSLFAEVSILLLRWLLSPCCVNKSLYRKGFCPFAFQLDMDFPFFECPGTYLHI